MSRTSLWNNMWNKIRKPTVVRDVLRIVIVVLLVAVGGITLRGFVTLSYNSFSAIYASVLARLANDDRRTEVAPELAISELLTRAAELKAKDMAENNYFAHTSPQGKTPWYWFDLVGYDYQYAGENLAVNFAESEDVNTAWMNSPLHRANIVNKKFTEIGIGMATGTYQGKEAVYVVQMFGRPIAP